MLYKLKINLFYFIKTENGFFVKSVLFTLKVIFSSMVVYEDLKWFPCWNKFHLHLVAAVVTKGVAKAMCLGVHPSPLPTKWAWQGCGL
jgi:hypothetical protein